MKKLILHNYKALIIVTRGLINVLILFQFLDKYININFILVIEFPCTTYSHVSSCLSNHTLARLLGLTHTGIDFQDLRPSRLASVGLTPMI